MRVGLRALWAALVALLLTGSAACVSNPTPHPHDDAVVGWDASHGEDGVAWRPNDDRDPEGDAANPHYGGEEVALGGGDAAEASDAADAGGDVDATEGDDADGEDGEDGSGGEEAPADYHSGAPDRVDDGPGGW